MKTIICSIYASILLGVSYTWGTEPAAEVEKYWPQWRGPHATGVAPYGDPPVEWSEDKNIRWKLEIPGRGSATPIIWDDQIFVLSAIDTERQQISDEELQQKKAELPEWQRGRATVARNVHKFVVMSIDRKSGRALWQKTARESLPHEGVHRDGTWASSSPVTDGEHVFAYFGSNGLYCYDMQGDLQWQKDLGDMRTRASFGEGSSPALFKNTIVINWDHEGPSFIVALDKNTGKQLWKVDRDERTSWSTPLIVEVDGTPQVVVSATNRSISYDLSTGEVVWESTGMTENAIPSPVVSGDVVYLMSGFRGSALQAIRFTQAKGKVNDTSALLWTFDKDTPYVPSPLLYGDNLYFVKNRNGIITNFNITNGEPYYGPERLQNVKGVYASPVGAAGRVYLASREGTTVVFEQGPEFKLLATNELDDGFDASPAIVDGELYLRGNTALYCISAN
jgi:outer membrane protein assembly factor BamB